jgi:hypothetical protein
MFVVAGKRPFLLSSSDVGSRRVDAASQRGKAGEPRSCSLASRLPLSPRASRQRSVGGSLGGVATVAAVAKPRLKSDRSHSGRAALGSSIRHNTVLAVSSGIRVQQPGGLGYPRPQDGGCRSVGLAYPWLACRHYAWSSKSPQSIRKQPARADTHQRYKRRSDGISAHRRRSGMSYCHIERM